MQTTVDCTDRSGGEQYKYIAEKSVEDLGLTGTVEGIWMYIRPEEPLFIISIKYKEFVGKNTIGELGSVQSRAEGVKITLFSEVDVGDALKTLWGTYGRDRVEQGGRMEIRVDGVEAEEVKDIKIRDKPIDVGSKVNELALRIVPEGFRVRHVTKKGGEITIVAAEDPIKEEWKRQSEAAWRA